MNARGTPNRTATNKQTRTRRHARTARTARDTQNNIPTSDFRRRSVITRRRDRSGPDIVTTAYCSVPRNRRRCRFCAGERHAQRARDSYFRRRPRAGAQAACTASLFIGGGAVHAPSYGFFSLCAQANFRWQMRPARTHTHVVHAHVFLIPRRALPACSAGITYTRPRMSYLHSGNASPAYIYRTVPFVYLP